VNGDELLATYCLGGAAIALWILARFPKLGPRRPVAVIVGLAAGWGGLSLAAALLGFASSHGRFGVLVGLVAIVFPALTAAFWVAGCALRALAEMPLTRR
jgi:hypothetical protein